MDGATSVLVLIVVVVGAFALVMYIQSFLVKKAMRQVISRFRAQGATSPEKATTVEKLGLVQRDFLGRIGRARDYKPQAMRLLVQKNAIRATPDGRIYLSEDGLRESQLNKYAGLD